MPRIDERGVTLIELMVAMLLLTVALVAVAAALPYAMYGVAAGGYQTTATLLAAQAIEMARSTPYSNLSALTTIGGTDGCGGGTGTFVALTVPVVFDGFARCTDVQAAPSTTTVTVVVRFTGVGGVGAGTIYDTSMVTVVAQ